MQVTNIKQYASPRYPDKDAVLSDRSLIYKLPDRWKRNAAVAAVLTAAAGLLMGCSHKAAPPVFEHGDGQGVFGGLGYSAILSEEAALQVINQTASSEGIVFVKDDSMVLKNVKLPSIYGPDKRDLILDGVDRSKKIAFEYISEKDYSSWALESELDLFDVKSAAHVLAKELGKRNDKIITAVFYDPMTFDATDEQAIEKSKSDLAAQVRDFIRWLKAEKII